MVSSTTLDPGTAAAIREALQSAARGRMDDARRIGENALANGGNVVALNAMLGTFCLNSGDFQKAVSHLRLAHAERPQDSVIALNLGTALVQLGLFADALSAVPEQLAEQDSSGKLMRLRGFCAQSLDDYPTAIKAYDRAVAMFPTDWESWNNLGNCLRCAGDMERALEALQRAATIAADAPPVRLNLANANAEAGKLDEAEAEYRAMAMEFPSDWRSLRELHILLRSQAREDEALQAIEEARRRNPEDLELILAVASQRLHLLDNEGAEAAYNEVIRRDPANPSGNLGLAVTYELSNRATALTRLVTDATTRGVDEGVINFIRAVNDRRSKRFQDGLEALAQVPTGVEPARRAQLLGQLHDGAGNYDEAWRAFVQMNEVQRTDLSNPEERAAAYRRTIRASLEATTPEWAAKWKSVNVDDARPTPVFLVGFPRSGTTLLDTMLMGHPGVDVLEEEPTLHRAGELLKDYPGLPVAEEGIVAAARDAYFAAVAKKIALTPGKLIIDKNPLFTAALPLIRRIFPDAKIILALRHPCDVVLSCFATNFNLNDGMSSFLRLDTTAELYDLCFSYYERVQQLLPLHVHQIVYEQVVADREQQLRELLNFLGLPWDEQVLDHQQTARTRGRIKTASYAQVAEPLYSRSSGRWRNYRAHLEPVLPVLTPWIEKFGYEQ